MKRSLQTLQKISLAFTAGCLGGLANAVFLWLFGVIGLTAALGVYLAPTFTPPWLYQRLVWGGIWGWLFLLPLTGLSYPARGLLFSLGPSWYSFWWSFPSRPTKGSWDCSWAI
jgi:hypothetical protein